MILAGVVDSSETESDDYLIGANPYLTYLSRAPESSMMNLEAELKMDHLKEDIDLEKMRDELAESQQAKNEDEERKLRADPRDQEQMLFSFTYTDVRGKLWQGDFVNEILDIGKRTKVGILQSKLNGGIPAASLDDDTMLLNRVLAHMTFSIIKRPKWAENFTSLRDVGLLLALWAKVVDHENFFFRVSPSEKAGGAEDSTG